MERLTLTDTVDGTATLDVEPFEGVPDTVVLNIVADGDHSAGIGLDREAAHRLGRALLAF